MKVFTLVNGRLVVLRGGVISVDFHVALSQVGSDKA
jgi:hypothetical protein